MKLHADRLIHVLSLPADQAMRDVVKLTASIIMSAGRLQQAAMNGVHPAQCRDLETLYKLMVELRRLNRSFTALTASAPIHPAASNRQSPGTATQPPPPV